ncbi:Secondary metabolism regulator LAE1 [Colletotrichum orbiculare MAFF 240422]|uniref:Secondary metabolism regulator LAE1 n=1 Tax=Colletotrichum orbiculare (strain 104-T / ATCC 96160 / CBS 514.97 / LARS 414 / MAFF 240422) TaxID=1213857 RepID=N4VYZ1_COLOR|nr:Secondary metabolism regulator LAE1 [Colletotrichum orbiculare MAFF 240422]
MSTEQPTSPAPASEDEVHIVAEEAPEVTDDAASDVATSLASSNTSITASVYNYRLENGRTYHAYKDGKYNLPNDETENDRLDLQHNLFLMTFNNRLGNAPPNDKDAKVGRVLDVGTGTGIWACEFGEEHPEAEVLGFDLSATFPTFAPPNVSFEVDDLEETWTYSRKFDYIHSRMLNGCIADWDVYAKKCFDNLNPGGWVEFNETSLMPRSDDGTLKEDATILKIAQLIKEASVKFGRPAGDMSGVKDVLTRAGFVDVQVRQLKWPINTWPKEQRYKELGAWAHDNIVTGWDGLCMAILTRGHEWTREEVLLANMECRKEFKDRRIHAYWPVYSAFGRKPAESEVKAAAETPSEA